MVFDCEIRKQVYDPNCLEISETSALKTGAAKGLTVHAQAHKDDEVMRCKPPTPAWTLQLKSGGDNPKVDNKLLKTIPLS